MKYKFALVAFSLFSSSFAIAEPDFGPLKTLIGTWKSTTSGGVDIAPSQKSTPIGEGKPAVEPFYEVITFEAAADATNASDQYLTAIYYSQEVFRKKNNSKFHDQRGYLIYDKKNNAVYNAYCVPRATCVVAEGKVGKKITFNAKSTGIAQSDYMDKNAKTTDFIMTLDLSVPNKITYQQTTKLNIYGKPFAHTDASTLVRVK